MEFIQYEEEGARSGYTFNSYFGTSIQRFIYIAASTTSNLLIQLELGPGNFRSLASGNEAYVLSPPVSMENISYVLSAVLIPGSGTVPANMMASAAPNGTIQAISWSVGLRPACPGAGVGTVTGAFVGAGPVVVPPLPVVVSLIMMICVS